MNRRQSEERDGYELMVTWHFCLFVRGNGFFMLYLGASSNGIGVCVGTGAVRALLFNMGIGKGV